jgi:alpha-1,2-mannosyltransferase
VTVSADAQVEAPAEGAAESTSATGLLRAAPLAARDLAFVLLALFAFVSALLVIRAGFRDDTIGFDFRGTLWDAALAIRDGRSPYPPPVEAEVDVGNPALYPPFLMLLVAPLTFLPWWLGMTVWTTVQVSAIGGTLALLRVRDPRCYALALISIPVMGGLAWGNATLLLVPLVALAWRWRNGWLRAGIVVGLAIASKLFVWPLLVWLFATRRYRAAGAAAVATAGVILLPWAAIGFEGLTSYPDLLRVAESIYATHSFSIATVMAGFGLDPGLASRGALAVGVAIATGALYAGRRGADEVSISLAVLAAILGSPILWEYYYALLLVPLAIVRPRFSGLWMLLPLFYVTHRLPRELLGASQLEPGGSAWPKPDGVPMASWVFNHAPPGQWPALGHAALATAVIATVVVGSLRTKRS